MWSRRSPLAPRSGVLPLKACLSGPRACLKEQHQGREARGLRATQMAEMRTVLKRTASPRHGFRQSA